MTTNTRLANNKSGGGFGLPHNRKREKMTPWQKIQSRIKQAKDIAKKEAASTGWCVRSRGALITAVNRDGDRLDDGGYLITTKKDFFETVESLKEDGAVSISIEGGYDVAEAVRDWGTGDYEPDFSQWSFDYWTKNSTTVVLKKTETHEYKMNVRKVHEDRDWGDPRQRLIVHTVRTEKDTGVSTSPVRMTISGTCDVWSPEELVEYFPGSKIWLERKQD